MKWLLTTFLVLAPSLATAATIVDVVTVGDCDQKTGVLDNNVLRDKILAANKVPFSSKTLTLYSSGKFGAELERLAANCDPSAGCVDDKASLPNAFEAARPLNRDPVEQRDGFTIFIDKAIAPLPAKRAAAFLDGNWAWLKIRCVVDSRPEAKQPEVSDTFFGPPKLVIAKSEDDAGKGFDKRGFATVGYSRNEVEDTVTTDVDVFIGFTDPFRRRDSPISLQPFAAYQRHSKKKIDDLSLGLAAVAFPSAGGQVRLKGAWETDRDFNASVWRADLSWTTPWLDGCEDESTENFYATCEATLVGDYAEIVDVGAKADLAKLSSFTRIGGDLLLELGFRAGDAGFVTFAGKYSGRHATGGDADADLSTLSLGFAPGKRGPYKVSLDYTDGRDLTSLARQRSVVLSFGFRH